VKQLLLFRHAKSSWGNDRLPDRDRPLSERGERDAPRMGGRLRERRARPDVLLTSPATRTMRTSNLLVRALGCRREIVRVVDALYLATPEEILRVLAAEGDGFESILVVGHNPGLTELANLLLTDLALDNLPTSGVVAIDCAADDWRDLRAANRRLAYYDYPKNPELFVTEN
jgi:phosphohistidine phosphatase